MPVADPTRCDGCGAMVRLEQPPWVCPYCQNPMPVPDTGRVWLTDVDVLDLLRRAVTGVDATFLHPAIPPKKVANARKVHAATVPADEEILGIYDGTVFGSAKDGFVVTRNRIAWKNTMESAHAIEWHHIEPYGVWPDGTQIIIGAAKIDTLYSSADEGLDAWCDVLCEFARIARSESKDASATGDPASEIPDPGWGGPEVVVAAAGAAATWGGMGAAPPSGGPAWQTPSPAPAPYGGNAYAGVERLASAPYDPFAGGGGCSIVDVHPSGQRILAGGASALEIRSSADGRSLVRIATPEGVLAARFSRDGNWLLAGCMDSRVHLYDPNTGQMRGSTEPMRDFCDEVVWLGSSTWFAAASQSGELWIVDGQTMQVHHRLLGPDPSHAQLGGIAANGDGSRVFVSVGSRLGAFEASTGRVVWRIDEALVNASRIAVSPSGDVLVAAGYDGVAFFDARTGAPGLQFPFRCAQAVRWPEPGGRRLRLRGGDDDEQWSWSPRPRFSPTADTIAVQDHVGNLVFIDVQSAVPYPVARAKGCAFIEDLAWFGDNNHVVLGMSDNSLAIWTVRPMQPGLHCRALG